MRHFFERTAYALRLEDGRPVGEPIRLSSGAANGSWITIDDNIAVWNGTTSFGGPDVVVTHEAIIAAELPLPGATDIGDADGSLTITDAIAILDFLFRGGDPPGE
jgi:hypothetical protein